MINSSSITITPAEARWLKAVEKHHALIAEAEAIIEAWDCPKASRRRQRVEAKAEAAGRKASLLWEEASR